MYAFRQYQQKAISQLKAGFTLIELILVMVIIGIVFSLGGLLLAEGFGSSYAGIDVLRADWQGRIALTRMERELRHIRRPNSLNMSVANQVTFTNLKGETITYSRSGNTLMRNAEPLADGVSALAFTYYNRNRVVVTNPALSSTVRYILISMTVTEGDTNHSFITVANPRNLP